MENKTVQQRAEEKYPHIQIGQEAYISGDHDRQAIADAEYKELQDKAFQLLNEVSELMVAINILKAKYGRYKENLEWHLDNNTPSDIVREQINIQMDAYNEIINDLGLVVLIPSPPKIDKGEKE